jgi:hypothetical protein
MYMARSKWYVELYPMFNSISRYVRADGTVGRLRHTYQTKRDAEAAEQAFRKGQHRGLLMDHMLFVDKVEA